MRFEKSAINGVLVNCFIVCKKKVWLQAHNIHTNKSNLHLQIGSVYAEIRKNDSRKFGNIEVDEIVENKHIKVTEYKKTFSNVEASKMQLLFYMYNLQKELNLKKIEGLLVSEETDEKKYFILNDENIKLVDIMLDEIVEIVNSEKIPVVEKTNLCLNCGHNFYCL